MITIFTTPKAYEGHIGIIQRNALQSWTRLRPRPEIFLFGDEEGTRQAAADSGTQFVPDVARSASGTPLISDMFALAEQRAQTGLLCFVNADIVLMSDFMRAVRRFEDWQRKFLIVGRRWDIDVKEPI